MSERATSPRIQRILRDATAEVLGTVVRRYRTFAAAEDAVQEALLAAAIQWERDGVPDNPRGWLVHVASRKIADEARSEIARRKRETIVVALVPPEDQLALAADDDRAETYDDTLELLFGCCHPALSAASAIALTLRALGGLTTAEIARAFFVPEATMAQRVSRAKQTLRDLPAPFAAPAPEERRARLARVMHVLYLVFNEGYTATSGDDLYRTDLSAEAIRLARMLVVYAPDEPEVLGLLALMLLTDARRKARTGPNGELVPLDEQDRSRWDRAAIDEGVALVSRALPEGRVGPYQLEAAIAAVHDEAARAEDTDWAQIEALYGVLFRMTGNPMVALSRAIADGMVRGPDVAIARIAELSRDGRLEGSHRVDAALGHLYERRGDRALAREAYLRAAARTTSSAERDYLLVRAARLGDAT